MLLSQGSKFFLAAMIYGGRLDGTGVPTPNQPTLSSHVVPVLILSTAHSRVSQSSPALSVLLPRPPARWETPRATCCRSLPSSLSPSPPRAPCDSALPNDPAPVPSTGDVDDGGGSDKVSGPSLDLRHPPPPLDLRNAVVARVSTSSGVLPSSLWQARR